MQLSNSQRIQLRRLGFLAALATAMCASASAVQNDDFYAATTTTPSTLYRVNWTTGNTINIGSILNIEPVDIAISPGGQLFAATVDELYTLDPVTGSTQFVGPVSTFFALEGLEFSAAGTLYACNFNGQLMTLDPQSGISSPVLNLPVIFSGDLASLNANTMYATIDGANGNELFKIDLSGAGNHQNLGLIAAGASFDALDFDGSGNLIAITTSGDVYRIPNFTTSGTGVLIGSMSEFPAGPIGGMTSAGNVCPATSTYCTAGTTSSGCTATMSWTGTPSASAASGFVITVSNVESQKQGILFYGINNSFFSPQPWGSGSSFLCVRQPTQRMGTQNSGGTGSCAGTLSIDWNAYIATHPGALGAPMAPGQPIFAQGWFRDPPSPKTTSLSNALRFIVCQ